MAEVVPYLEHSLRVFNKDECDKRFRRGGGGEDVCASWTKRFLEAVSRA